MKYSLFAGLAAIAAMGMIVDTPAEAGPFKKRGFSQTAGANAAGFRRAPRGRPRKLSGQRRRSASPATWGTIQAVNVYLQWRKCLDNILPKCP